MKRAAIYTRYSSDRQHERSNADQAALCERYCARQSLAVVATYADSAVSGSSTLDRAQFQRLMADAKRGLFDIIVVESISRAFRDQADYHAARKRLAFLEIEIHGVNGRISGLEGSVTAMVAEQQLVDLAQHVRRGQAGAVRRGQHVGPPAFGYRLLPPEKFGEPGKLAIDDASAAIVVEIFTDYARGQNPRAIAAALNARGIASPRVRQWNASTIYGSRKRMNGILQNALYDGRMIWNRQRFVKDPDRNTRVSRPNAASEWIESEAPALRIVDRVLWNAVQARRQARAGNAGYRAAPRHMLSGLIKCGACGSSYIVAGSDKRGTYLRCTGFKEGRGCGNRTTIGLKATERRVLDSIERELAAPELIAGYVREFHKAMAEQHRQEDRRRIDLGRDLAKAYDGIARLVASIEQGLPARPLAARLQALETQKAALEAALSALPPKPVRLHPQAAEMYRRKIAGLSAALAAQPPQRRAETQATIRELVEKIVVQPTAPYKPPNLELYGRLAAILQVSQPDAGFGTPESWGALVAGEDITRSHRLPPIIVRLRA